MNEKENFKTWVLSNLKEKSGSASAYLKSLEWLSARFLEKGKINKNTIFEIDDIDLVSQLYTEVKKIQKDKNSYVYDKNAPSYGEKYFYSASLSKYKEFLLDKKDNFQVVNTKSKTNPINAKFNIESFHQDCTTANLKYSNQLVTRFISSLATKPFVLLSGLSGSGKTKLAQAFAQWISENKSQYCLVPVGADWINREPLLGYVNALDDSQYIVPENGALQLLID